MKKTNLEHSFDHVKLSDAKKQQILDELNHKKQSRAKNNLLQPLVAFGLITFLVGGLYIWNQFVNNPHPNQPTIPATSIGTNSTPMLPFTTPYTVVSKLYTSEDFPVALDQWIEIAKILNQAIFNPSETAMTMELRQYDLQFGKEVPLGGYTIMIRDFREIYKLGSGTFSAYHLEDANSQALKSLLTEVLNGPPLSKSPISGSYHMLRKLTDQTEYTVTDQNWTDLHSILDQMIADPQINAVTDDLRADDLELMDNGGARIFIREYREVYLTTLSGVFSAYHLETPQSLELKALLTTILNQEPVNVNQKIRNILEAQPAAQTIRRSPDQPISIMYGGFDSAGLGSLLSAKYTKTGTVDVLPSGIIFLEAVGNGFGVFDGTLYLRSGYELSTYSLKFTDTGTLDTVQTKLTNQYEQLVEKEAAVQAVSPQELDYTSIQGPSDAAPITLSSADVENINSIFKSSDYIDTLTPFDQGLIDSVRFMTPRSETMTLFTPSGDLYVTRKSTEATDHMIYHFRLSPEMTLKLKDLLALIRQSN